MCTFREILYTFFSSFSFLIFLLYSYLETLKNVLTQMESVKSRDPSFLVNILEDLCYVLLGILCFSHFCCRPRKRPPSGGFRLALLLCQLLANWAFGLNWTDITNMLVFKLTTFMSHSNHFGSLTK